MNKKEEKLLREYVRRNIIKPTLASIKEEKRKEDLARLWVRKQIREFKEQLEHTVIYEAADIKPHDKTYVNFLRDSFKKLMPNIENDYKSLTTNPEQRESFRNHYLAATIRMFDQIDGLSANVDIEDYSDLGAEPVMKDPDAANAENVETPEQPEASEDAASVEQSEPASDVAGAAEDDIDSMLNSLQEATELNEEELEEAENFNVVKDLKPKKEKKGLENEIDKEMQKKDILNKDREKFSQDVGGDLTGRNKAYDSFKKTKNYIHQNYSDLSDPDDKEGFKKWCIYNLKLTFDGFDNELQNNPDVPDIANPEQHN